MSSHYGWYWKYFSFGIVLRTCLPGLRCMALIGIVRLIGQGTAVAGAAGSSIDSQTTETLHFNIPVQPLTAALNAFAETTGWQVSYPADMAADKTSTAVVGAFSAEAGLQQLLSGTGLTYHFTDAQTFTLVRDTRPQRAASSQAQQTASSRVPSTEDPLTNTDQAQTIQVPEIVVKEVKQSGYVAEDARSATKSDTPLLETPQSITVVTRDRMVSQEVHTIAEALRYTAGVQAEPFGFEPRFTFLQFRGFDATQNGLFKDGLQLRNPSFVVSYNLEPYGAEQLDVLRGPASFLYGQGSPGGLLNYITKRPIAKEFQELQFLAGSFDRYEGRLDFGGTLNGNDKVVYRLTGLFRESGTQFEMVPNDRVYIAPALTWQATPATQITFLVNFQKDELGSSQALPAEGTLRSNPNGMIDPARFTGSPDADKQDRTEASFGYEVQHDLTHNWEVLQKFRYNWTKLDGFTVFSSAFASDQRTVTRSAFGSLGNLDALAVDTQIHGKFSTGPLQHNLTGGVDFQRINFTLVQTFGAAGTIDIFNRLDFGTPIMLPAVFLDQETTQLQTGVYVQDQIKLYDKVILTVGGRHDWAENETENRLTSTTTDQHDRKGTMRAALTYLFDFGLAPYFSYSTFFLPSIGLDPTGQPFKPETGRQWEIGVKFQPEGSRSFVSVALFDLTRENFVQTDPASFLSVQTGKARSRGVELEGIASFDSGVDLIATYTLLENEVRKSANPVQVGNRLTQTPAHFGSLWANYRGSIGNWSGFEVGGGARFTGPTFADVGSTFKVPGFIVGDAVVAYTWQQYRVALNVTNILDHDQFGCFARGGSNFCNFGDRRTFVGSITYRF